MSVHSTLWGDFIVKTRIRDTAIQLLADKGYHDMTIKSIAKSAGIAVGSIYTHFENKEDIIDCLFEEEFNKRIQYMSYLDKENIIGVDKISAYLDFYFDELKQDRMLTIVLIRESTNPALIHLNGVKLFTEQCRVCFEEILRDISKTKEIRDLDPIYSSQIILNAIRGTVFDIALGNRDGEEVESIKEELKKFISFAIIKK